MQFPMQIASIAALFLFARGLAVQMKTLLRPDNRTPFPYRSWSWGVPQATKSGGFTLIELMMTVVIVAILASIAYPSYMEHVKKGNRAQAQAFLMDVAQRQQNYLIINRQYASDLSELGFSDGAGSISLSSNLTALASAYDILGLSMGASSGPPPRFNLMLSPVSTSPQASDGALCVANTGARVRYCGEQGEVAW